MKMKKYIIVVIIGLSIATCLCCISPLGSRVIGNIADVFITLWRSARDIVATPTATPLPIVTPTPIVASSPGACESPPGWEPAYTVKQGDTVYAISRIYNVNPEEIAEANCLNDNRIYIGQILYVPGPNTP